MEKIRIICLGAIFGFFTTGMLLLLGRLLTPPFFGLSKISIIVIAGGIFVVFSIVYSFWRWAEHRLVNAMKKITRNQL